MAGSLLLACSGCGPEVEIERSPVRHADGHFQGLVVGGSEPDGAFVVAQLRAQKPGMAPYRPSAEAKRELDAAASALRPVVEHLRAAGVRTKKFAQAVQAFEQLASGEGNFSTDDATEDIHPCFSYGIAALK
ncbi:hypothetical protein [Polyangium mundeleinium]|uniref:Lipoprotein n=1 Tax=Polyangium mundeleinium TaxID=2995306 RepID=A0ABT5EP18_9BACT|nr:hypothetical protein [Polyangium mundeleinium]MDC0743069.1 hypothetical protein [Polyangium mundeleinium]